MNATNRLDLLISDIFKNPTSDFCNGINQETSIQPSSSSRLTFSEHSSHPSTILPSAITTIVPLPPRRDSSSMKHHRRRPRIDQTDKQNKQDQPLLNSSTLDDLFRALTLECEQYLASISSFQNKTYGQIIVQPSSDKQTGVESNDEDYENLHKSQPLCQTIKTNISPLKTSIEVISPIKRHVVSITVSSKISSPQLIVSSTKSPSCHSTTSMITPTICHSSEDDSTNISSSSTNRKRRRRTRKQIISSSTTRSSSSSTERKELHNNNNNKKSLISKRSCSTDPRYQRHKQSQDNISNNNSYSSSQKQFTKPSRRRDVSLQHSSSNSGRVYDNYSSPLSVLLTSTKPTSDFLSNSHQHKQRRSRLESIDPKPLTLFYQPSTIRNNNNNKNKNNIPTHRIPSYPVY
ncbi:unnamed protein product [Adineta steineri]|uniref:Uncharacterized protein n=1 Tax=Adineta steineri TaxID=433720 RepID=A0A815CST4_9BILA|nr:unnamed protein product [Adineta steineri]CAF1287648.1 unnamed protein product [Adineta steineri]CAF3764686.1 unnamed protein product [Adineta steineri]